MRGLRNDVRNDVLANAEGLKKEFFTILKPFGLTSTPQYRLNNKLLEELLQ